jgi:hypothetical protein
LSPDKRLAWSVITSSRSGATTFSTITLSITTFSIKTEHNNKTANLSISDTQHSNMQHLVSSCSMSIMLSVVFFIVLNGYVLSVFMLNVVAPSRDMGY